MIPNKTKGEYRPIYEALFHAPEYLQLSAHAKLVLLTIKCNCGPTGIKSWPGLSASLQEMCKLLHRDVKKALAELEAQSWIATEGNLVWVVNGLRFEPQISTSRNHQAYVERELARLPECDLLRRFREKYAAYLPKASEGVSHTPSKALPRGIDTPTRSSTPSPTNSPSPSPAVASYARESAPLPAAGSRSARLVAMANRGITEKFGEQPRPIRHSHSSVDETIAAWDAAGVPEDFAARHLFERARSHGGERPPTTLSYFRQPILEAWEAEQAHRAAATVAVPEGGAVVVGAIGSDAMHVRMAVKYAKEGHVEWQDECTRLGVKWQEVA
jgi:hypothetical protein